MFSSTKLPLSKKVGFGFELIFIFLFFFHLQAGAEKKVTFDWGPAGSKAEDCFFGIMALDQGYSFNFIQVIIDFTRVTCKVPLNPQIL